MREAIYTAIEAALRELGITDAPFVVERPGDFSHGDYSTNAALAGYRFAAVEFNASVPTEKSPALNLFLPDGSISRNPRELAESLQKKLENKIDGVVKVETAGPGFINFFLSREAIVKEIDKIAQGEFSRAPSEFAGQTVMVEYTQPNPFKPFHIGHLMSNTYGESLVRLLGDAGAKVIPVNYQGDVGLHIAKALWGLQHKGYNAEDVAQIGEAYVLGHTAYEEDAEAKKEIMVINKQVYAADPAILPLYKRGREVTLAHFEDLYQVLGTKFEKYFFESEVWKMGEQLVREGTEKGIFKESDGAIVFPGEDFGLHTRVFITREGLPTYEAKDLGLAMAKLAYAPFDLSITTTAIEQGEYFKVVFEALAQLRPELRGKFIRVTHGLLHLTTGKMSSRKGNVITGESLIMDLKNVAKEKMQERNLTDPDKTAEHIAVGAIKYAVLKQGSSKDISFDPEKSLSLEGDSGPYLQYARVRACSLLKKAQEAGIDDLARDKKNIDMFISNLTLDRTLIHFTEVVERATTELEPHHLTTYLTELAAAFNSWYANVPVIGGDYPHYALKLAKAFEKTMAKGLDLLGIPTPEEM